VVSSTLVGARLMRMKRTGLLENLLSLSPPIASTLLSSKSALLSFLLKRLGQDKLASDRDQNRFYAAELLSILLGGDVEGALEGRERIAKEGAVDILLRVLSVCLFLSQPLPRHHTESCLYYGDRFIVAAILHPLMSWNSWKIFLIHSVPPCSLLWSKQLS
jgi:hypothetical protein